MKDTGRGIAQTATGRHTYVRANIAFGRAHGVEVRALCGEWAYPAVPSIRMTPACPWCAWSDREPV